MVEIAPPRQERYPELPGVKHEGISAALYDFEYGDEVNVPHFKVTLTSGYLPRRYRLQRPIDVVAYYDAIEIVASEPRFAIHAAGRTLEEALRNLGSSLVEDYEWLARSRSELGEHLTEQLAFLESVLDPA